MRYPTSFKIPNNFREVMQIDDLELRAETALRDGFAGHWLIKACSGNSDAAVLGRMMGEQDEYEEQKPDQP